jgi:hypothetical protein
MSPPRDLIKAGIGTLFGKGGLGRFEETKTVTLGVGAPSPDAGRLALGRHDRKSSLINGESLRI